ncbi:MAG: phenylalanine--tRNA ligase subunit alpha [Firmicutes bacterium]|nr:phenylalanine--tRNA ligase subunit alpha [Bacillota bacterium]
METKLKELKVKGLDAIAAVDSLEALEQIRLQYLGKKGELTAVLRQMGNLPPEERPVMGKLSNEVRDSLETALAERKTLLESEARSRQLATETLDVTLPGRKPARGTLHPLSLVRRQIEDIFLGMGYSIYEGPEIESDYYNFVALNLPKHHPARDMQDTFYIDEDTVLRTHTSPVQVRTMEKLAPNVPLKMICPGKVYRKDDDATHSPMFWQIEGLVIDAGISLADLKGTLNLFARELFGPKQEVRLRPSFFPFTEPSVEVDIRCTGCGGSGCRMCSDSGWLEILGAGMVHPKVLSMSGYDPAKVSGFAFGLGIDRVAMLKYGITDIRHLYTNDIRALTQFRQEV